MVLGVQRPTRMLRGPKGGGLALNSNPAGSHSAAALPGTPPPPSQHANNLYFVIEGKSLHTSEQQGRGQGMHQPRLVDNASPDVDVHKDRKFEIDISGDVRQSGFLATGMNTVPHAVARNFTSAKASLLDISSDQLKSNQVPSTTGVAVLPTAAVVPLATAAPAPLPAPVPAPVPVAASQPKQQLSIFMLFAMLLLFAAVALALAYFFFVKHRRHEPLDDTGTSGVTASHYSKLRQKRLSRPLVYTPPDDTGTSSGTASHYSKLHDKRLSSPRPLKDADHSVNDEPARDRNPMSSPTPATSHARRRSCSDPTRPTLAIGPTDDMPGAVSMLDPGAAVSMAQAPMSPGKRRKERSNTQPEMVIDSNADTSNSVMVETPSPIPQRLATPGGAAVTGSKSQSFAGNAADAAAGGYTNSSNPFSSYAAKRKERRSLHAASSHDFHSTQEPSPRALEEKGGHAGDHRKSQRAAAEATTPSTPTHSETISPTAVATASRRSRSAYAEARRSRLHRPETLDPASQPASSVPSTSEAVNSSGEASGASGSSKSSSLQRSSSARKSTIGSSPISRERKSVGRLLAQQNAKAEPQKDDEELMF